MIVEADRVLLGDMEILFKVDDQPWALIVAPEYTERRCNLYATAHIYNPLTHSVLPGPRSWDTNIFWALRGSEVERLGELVEHVIRTTIQESAIRRATGKEEGWVE